VTDDQTPAEALAAIRSARSAVGVRMTHHWGWDIALAVAVGGVFAAHALPPPWGTLAMMPCMLAVAGLSVFWRNRAGVRINSLAPPQARGVALALALLLMILLLVAMLSSLLLGLRWPSLAAGAVAAIATFFASRAWRRACRRALSSEDA